MRRQNGIMVSNIFLVFTFFAITLGVGNARLLPSFGKLHTPIMTNDILSELDREDAPDLSLEDKDSRFENDESSFPQWTRVKLFSGPVVDAIRGQNVILTCEVIANSPLEIAWYKRSGAVTKPVAVHKVGFLPKFATQKGRVRAISKHLIECVQPKDIGSYSCAAISDWEVVSNETWLTVTEENIKNRCEPVMESVVTLNYLDTLSVQGSNVILPCRSLPPYETQWLDNNGKPVSNSIDKKILPQGDLLIKNLKWSDMGNFQCKVQSDVLPAKIISTFLYPTKRER